MAKIEYIVLIIVIISGILFMAIWFPSFGFDPLHIFTLDECRININVDLSGNPPLLLKTTLDSSQYGYELFYIPPNKGDIILQPDDIINLSCPSGTVYWNNNDTKESMFPIQCTGKGRLFKAMSAEEETFLRRFDCSALEQVARYTNKNGIDNLKEIEIGFQINETVFLQEMTILFDPNQQITAYSAYKLTHNIGGQQTGVPRPNFIAGEFFKDDIDKLYEKKSYTETINKQLGLPIDSDKYINTNNTLSRGHLTARADFIYGIQQNATFYYVNVAPQWDKFNGGNWNQLEISIRNLARDRSLDLDVYTGTHDIMTLPHSKTEKQTQLYLRSDDNGNSIPIPKMFWKVVYDPKEQIGIAFVGLNNPYKENVTEDVLCDNICNKLTFEITWKPDNITQGYGYCCEVDKLREKITNIPKSLNVTAILL